MHKRLVAGMVLMMAVQVHAQWYDPDKVNTKATTAYNGAIAQAQDYKWGEAKYLLLKTLQFDPKMVDAYLSYAGICGENKQYDSAIIMYERARSLDSFYFRDYNLPYSINLAGNGRFDDAFAAVKLFLTSGRLNERSIRAGEFRKRGYQFAIDMKANGKDVSDQFAPKNLGDSINTSFLEYFPSLPIEGDRLVFTRRVFGRNEDFFESRSLGKVKGSGNKLEQVWGKAKALDGINTDQNEGAQCISQDGEWLVFTGCNRPGGFGSCDIYISLKNPDGSWTAAENMGPNINTEFWESAPSLSPDKKDLYFSSRRSDGYGAGDIWVSHLTAKGNWGPAENLGPQVNTIGEESSPFIHPDNQTLYFTSDGLQGYGESDLFVARKGPKGDWSIPQNLGYPINTIDSEGSLVVTADGQTAYYASDRKDSKGGLDLYSFQMPKNLQPIRTFWVKGKVFDAKTNKGLPSGVELKDVATGNVIENVQTDETGNYLVTLPVGKEYSFTVNRKGYLFFSDTYSLINNPTDSIYEKNIPLEPVAVNTKMELKNILFETNSFRLNPSSYTELDKVVQLMKDNPTLKIQIGGHTDKVGKPEENMKLSNSRAKSVVDYIVSKQIVAARLSYKGFGSSKPIADNKTEAGKAKNRRTELVVTAN
ncbi:MAG: OmpA family protein [Chitinophagaceae bacterium]